MALASNILIVFVLLRESRQKIKQCERDAARDLRKPAHVADFREAARALLGRMLDTIEQRHAAIYDLAVVTHAR